MSVTLNITVVVPPQAEGVPELLFVNAGLHPPLTLAPPNHAR